MIEFEAVSTHAQWHKKIVHAIFRRSDRAVRHVRMRLAAQNLSEDTPIPWKAPRLPAYESVGDVVSAVIDDPSTLEDDDKECPVCGCEYDSDETMALQLRCSPRHIICRGCFTARTHSSSASKARWPHCRAQFYSEADLGTLAYGVEGKAYYADRGCNEMFNAFESFERSCADLYKELPEIADQELPSFTPALLMKIWHHLDESAWLESEASAPRDMQAAAWPESLLLLDELPPALEVVELLPGFNNITLNPFVLHEIISILHDCFGDAGMNEYLTFEQKLATAMYGSCTSLGLRPGFFEFVLRTLDRMLRFVQKRQCHDAEDCTG